MSIVDRLSELEERIADGVEVRPDELDALCASLRSNPAQITREQALGVVAQLNRLSAWAADQRDEFAEALASLGDGRRAMRGYSSLSGATTAQRLFRQA